VNRWYELIPDELQVRQQGTISDSSSFVFNGAISPAANGRDAAIQYNVSGTSQLPAIRAQSQRSGTPLGQMAGEITLVTSSDADQDFSCEPTSGGPPCRWGDYSAASPDPANNALVWGTNMISGPPAGPGPLNDDPAWQTQNFALTPDGATNALPTASFTASPNPVTTGALVSFNASASSDPDGPLADFSWDLDGNGSFETDTGTTPTASRSYGAAGPVTVRLRVRDSRGDTSDAAQTVTVTASGGGGGGGDHTPPTMSSKFKKVYNLLKALRRGFTGSLTGNEAFTAAGTGTISAKVAKRFRVIRSRTVVVARGKTSRASAGRAKIKFKFTRKARARLKRAKKVVLTLRITAKDAAGNSTKITRRVTLKRPKKKR
jgi:hypothetical protein